MKRVWLLLILAMLQCSGVAMAKDVKFALLLANQQGWKGEQDLPWVVSGDLRPMKKVLQRLGYQVIALVNKDATTARKHFVKLVQQMKAAKATTFLFYYSGHADKHHFHMGSNKKNALSYKEFLRFFMNLSVKRRFAILDACYGGAAVPIVQKALHKQARKTASSPATSKAIFQFINGQLAKRQRFSNRKELELWYRLQLPKGVKRPKKAFNFAKTPFLKREDGAGIHIIGTTGIAWHDPKLKASLLSAYLLRGLQGEADNIKDGKITIEELYNFVRNRLQQKGQKLDRFVLFNGNYTLAPNYQSELHLGSRILGQISVSIDQFTWNYKKKKRYRIAIPTIPGKGVVEIKHRGRCWRQQVSFPKGQKVTVTRYGRSVLCSRSVAQRKGSQQLTAQAYDAPKESAGHILSFSLGVSQLGPEELSTTSPFFELGYQYRFFGVSLGHYLAQAPADKPFNISRWSLQCQLGLPFEWNNFFGLFVGGYGRAGIALSDIIQQTQIELSMGAGVFADANFWLKEYLGLRLGAEVGTDYTPVAGLSGFSLQWKVRFSFLLHI